MNVLTGYMVKEILKGSLIALMLLLTLFNLFTFTDELSDLGKGHYGLREILYYLVLTSPRVFYELVPSAALLGSLFVLGSMGNHRELIAMQAAGLSIAGIIKAAMFAGAILVIVAILVGEFVAPSTERKAQFIKVSAQNEQVVLNTRYGLWLREGGKFINVREIQKNGALGDISIYDVDEQQQLTRALHAEQGVFLGKQEWKLEKIRLSDISTQKMTAKYFEEQSWKSSLAPDLLKIVVVNPDNLSLADLAQYIGFLKGNNQKSQVYELAFWGRIVNPLITFVMLLLSTPFVIGIQRGVSVGARMMIGVVIGMGFNIVDRIVGHLGLIYDYNSALVAVMPSMTVLLLVWIFARKMQRQ
ncbi:MAG: LPS export ABC transporter permease LptG [Methylococcaceae bacterium]|nr:LPS export ABC transporter permease LptG [Methylococcaceae bacterium]